MHSSGYIVYDTLAKGGFFIRWKFGRLPCAGYYCSLFYRCSPSFLRQYQVQAIPTFSGTTTFSFPSGGTATLDWAVYKPGAVGPAYVSAVDFTYAYTLKNWTNYISNGQLDILTPLLPSVTGATAVTTGFAQLPFLGPAAADPGAPSLTSLYFGGQFLTGDTTTSVWTSTLAPAFTKAQLTNISIGSGPIAGNSLVMAPGVPEPQTWALLIAMMGFSTWWMRRRQDEDEPMETIIAA
ncbi:MAG: PEP-CTERM sorting domain-containing protein [Mariprofundaceae bacterium]|nr:PEP-CTERM sorting domain-containing protein [Mariprofundaceae bacterium]